MAGVSNPISIDGAVFAKRTHPSFTKGLGAMVDANGKKVEVNAPVCSVNNYSLALEKNRNWFQDFAFEKIQGAYYGNDDSIAWLTGVPLNNPEFLSDYHFITLMRSIDKLIKPSYDGYIKARQDTPKAK